MKTFSFHQATNRFLPLALVLAMCGGMGQAEIRRQSYTTPAYIQFSAEAYTVSEAEEELIITLIRTGEYRQDTSVDYQAREGTARAGSDFTTVEGRITFPAGQSVATISIPILPDAITEEDETFEMVLFNPASNALIIQEKAPITIRNSQALAGLQSPQVLIEQNAEGRVVISWPQQFSDFRLESSPNLAEGEWVQVTARPALSGNRWKVVEVPDGTPRFYRLRKIETKK